MERLIRNERAQRIEEDALLVLLERQFDREEMEDERFAPPRSMTRLTGSPASMAAARAFWLALHGASLFNKSRSGLAARPAVLFFTSISLFAVALNESVRKVLLAPHKKQRGTHRNMNRSVHEKEVVA